MVRCFGVVELAKQNNSSQIANIYMPKYEDLFKNAYDASNLFNQQIDHNIALKREENLMF